MREPYVHTYVLLLFIYFLYLCVFFLSCVLFVVVAFVPMSSSSPPTLTSKRKTRKKGLEVRVLVAPVSA